MSAAREISTNAVQFHLWEIPGNENKSKVIERDQRFPGIRRRVWGKGKWEREIRMRLEEFLLMRGKFTFLTVMIFYSCVYIYTPDYIHQIVDGSLLCFIFTVFIVFFNNLCIVQFILFFNNLFVI